MPAAAPPHADTGGQICDIDWAGGIDLHDRPEPEGLGWAAPQFLLAAGSIEVVSVAQCGA